jgi:hypothetical protein
MNQDAHYWREKTKIACNFQIQGHCAVIAAKSPYFYQLFKEKRQV